MPGEKAGFPPDIAQRLITNGGAYELAEDGSAVVPDTSEVESERLASVVNEEQYDLPFDDEPTSQPANQPTANTQSPSGKSKDATEELMKPFLADGVDRDVIRALFSDGLTTPELVTQAIAAGRDLDKEIKGIGPKSFAELKTLYSEE